MPKDEVDGNQGSQDQDECAAVFWIADKASPTVQVDARLKLSVTDGNCPRWLIASGAIEGLTVAN